MKQLVEELNGLFTEFIRDSFSQVETGNKSAGQRARKTSLTIEKALKDFRKKSLDESKK